MRPLTVGRVTYEALAGLASNEATPSRLTAIPKLVVSSRLQEPLAWENSSLLRGDLEPGIRALKEQPGPPIRTMGSMSLAGSLLEIGLVDRLRLMVFPLTVGHRGREQAFANCLRRSSSSPSTRRSTRGSCSWTTARARRARGIPDATPAATSLRSSGHVRPPRRPP
jgi:dihydrofolate reductase